MPAVADERYRAPATAVGATEAAQDSAPRPREVTRALQLLWTVFILSVVTLHPSVRGDWWLGGEEVEAGFEDTALVIGIVVAGLFSGLYMGFVVLMGRRHNWARWAMAVFLVIGWAMLAVDLPTSLAETPAAAVADLVMAGAELGAGYLLFTEASTAWFSR